ncbi:MAG: hypothetical protein JNM31_11320 [Flavobacteriales bacterium]|nr:hypothetical protein [Flavobacteriales bacterium]
MLPAGSQKSLFALALLVSSSALFAQEICNNAIDDDGDGLIDLNDIADCSCIDSLSLSPLPNGGFESQSCCPNGISLTNCIQGWSQVTTPTTDYFHACDFMPAFVPTPLPDGDGCVGMFSVDGWQEYIGTCLSAPLPATVQASVTFKYSGFDVDGSVTNAQTWSFGTTQIAVYGFPTCPILAIVTTNCPAGWSGGVLLGSVTVLPNGSWQQAQINFTPAQNIEYLALGSPCGLPPSFQWTAGYGPYLLLD